MWLKSHRWVMEPTSRTERRLLLDTVRTRTETVRLFDHKYQNIDTGKYDRDSMPVINTQSLADICEDNYYRYPVEKTEPIIDEILLRRVGSVGKFIPKDDDFEDEDEESQIRCIDELLKAYL